MGSEQHARAAIDKLLSQAGWKVMDVSQADLHAGLGVVLREFPLEGGEGFADYLLYVDGKAAGVIEAKKQGATLTGVEIQSARYAQGLPVRLSKQAVTPVSRLLVMEYGSRLMGPRIKLPARSYIGISSRTA